MPLEVRPISYAQACEYVNQFHRHHKKPQGWKFGAAAFQDGKLVGVITAGRPVARMLDDGLTLEVTRCCTDGTRNACSLLYGSVRSAAKALGYHKVITYILAEEPGTSLKAVGFEREANVAGEEWVHSGKRRANNWPTGDKSRWCARLTTCECHNPAKKSAS